MLLLLGAVWPASGIALQAEATRTMLSGLLGMNAVALSMRLLMLGALRGSYAERGLPYWGSWLADIPAAVRLTLSTARTPRRWRGRQYPALQTS